MLNIPLQTKQKGDMRMLKTQSNLYEDTARIAIQLLLLKNTPDQVLDSLSEHVQDGEYAHTYEMFDSIVYQEYEKLKPYLEQ